MFTRELLANVSGFRVQLANAEQREKQETRFLEKSFKASTGKARVEARETSYDFPGSWYIEFVMQGDS